MGAAAVEVADGVALELETVNYKGRRSFRLGSRGGLVFVLVFVFGGFQVLGLGIAKDENQASAVWRPFEIVNALRNVGEGRGFATQAVGKTELGVSLGLCGVGGEGLAGGASA